MSAKGNPLRPEHVESIQGITHLVCLVLGEMLIENFGAMVEQGILRVVDVISQRANSTLYYVELLLSRINFVDIVRDVSMAIGKSLLVLV